MAQRPAPTDFGPSRLSRVARTYSGWDGIEIVPDSEEERMRNRDSDSIEISSDEEERRKPDGRLGESPLKVPGAWVEDVSPSPSKKVAKTLQTPGTPTSSRRATATVGTPSKKKVLPGTPRTPSSAKKTVPLSNKRPQIIQSTSADAAADQVVIPEWPTPKSKASTTGNKTRPSAARGAVRVTADAGDSSDSDVEVISGPTPIQPKPKPKTTPKPKLQPLYNDNSDSESSDTSSSESSIIREPPNKYAKYWTPPVVPTNTPTSRKVATPSKASGSKSPQKLSQAALRKLDAQKDMADRVEYAQQVYSWLNRKIFKDQLPSLDTIEIKWNNRLVSTAGKARFHRDRHGNEYVEIHLATKIVDSPGRIRNTLSHEMCHLACWIIDKQIQENHGELFHKWARKISQKDPVFEISVEHTYDISYNFLWECGSCDHVVGRFTNSLNPAVTKCPGCKTGTLYAHDSDASVSTESKEVAAKRTVHRSVAPIYIESSDEDDEPPASVHTQKEIYEVSDVADRSGQEIDHGLGSRV
ncbi:HMG box-containing protein C19G7.04 [Mycena sanguinolenta]|uniref:HMG box-containing protein C19G7.04 n=1 Tax=Mycena sanguinolenta TaxID=230812 RepID=A0A8H6YZ31_9AGAR|nr:HMG box-containing protein C19G7.04 [Mycena sanguinolenta]